MSVVIEPIGRATIADYFLADMNTAVDIVTKLKQPNIKILFDCYHIYNIHGDLKPLLERYIDLIGHIQIASIPARHEPDEGEVDYPALLKWLDDLGYKGYVGAEYKPRTTTDAGLGWMKDVFSNH